VAAQNCRKRKIDQINQLEAQVEQARIRKSKLMSERESLYRQREEWATKLTAMESDILDGMGKDVDRFRLDFNSPEVRIVGREAASPAGGVRGAAANAVAPAPAPVPSMHAQIAPPFAVASTSGAAGFQQSQFAVWKPGNGQNGAAGRR